MAIKELKETINELVSRNRIKEAISEIVKWAQENDHDQLKKDASLLSGTFTELNREKLLGFLSNSEASTRQSKLNYSILNLLNNVSEGDISEPPEVVVSPEGGKMKILMLTANPAKTTKLNLDKEHSVITQKLQQNQNYFNIILKKAVSGTEFKEFTQQEKPTILHFSGHGTKGKYAGIVVQNDDKNGEKLIPVKGLKTLFKFLKKQFKIKVVLLNACHTEDQAAVISEYVDYVIGTNVAIGDTAASAFSSGFYFQLAENNQMNIEDAFDSGRTEAVMNGADEENFVIYKEGQLLEIS